MVLRVSDGSLVRVPTFTVELQPVWCGSDTRGVYDKNPTDNVSITSESETGGI